MATPLDAPLPADLSRFHVNWTDTAHACQHRLVRIQCIGTLPIQQLLVALDHTKQTTRGNW